MSALFPFSNCSFTLYMMRTCWFLETSVVNPPEAEVPFPLISLLQLSSLCGHWMQWMTLVIRIHRVWRWEMCLRWILMRSNSTGALTLKYPFQVWVLLDSVILSRTALNFFLSESSVFNMRQCRTHSKAPLFVGGCFVQKWTGVSQLGLMTFLSTPALRRIYQTYLTTGP